MDQTQFLADVPNLTELVQGDQIKVTWQIPGLDRALTDYAVIDEIDASAGWLSARWWNFDYPIHLGNHPQRMHTVLSTELDRK
jgi:hypothetical protein